MELHLNTAELQASAVRRKIAGFLAQEASEDSDFSGAQLIVGELLANAIRHAPGPVCIRAAWEGEDARLIVRDSGSGFEIPSAPAGRTQEGGRGLALVRAFARSLVIRHVPGEGTSVEVILPLRRKASPDERS